MSRSFKRTEGLLLTLALLLSMSMSAFAYTQIDTGKTGSITVSPTDGQSIGTELTIYQVADVVVDNADQKYVLTEDFAASGVDLTGLDETETLAETLSSYVTEQKLSGTTRATGEDGSVKFDSLKLGLYLIIQTVAQPGESIVNPFLVSVPRQDDDGEWLYDVSASPKPETYELINVTVKKVWNDGGDTSSRPASVTVDLYKDSVLVEAVTLNSKNNWSYTWSGLAKSDGYSVAEELDRQDGYVATYSQSGYTFTITNTPKLAQTGQLNWPIPLLAGCGLALFAVGWGLVFLKKKKTARKA